jgi:hypothetical membrane protein
MDATPSGERTKHQPIVWVKQFVPDGPDLGERKEKRKRSGTANWVNSFTDKLPWLGPLLLILSTLYFLAQVAVAWVWDPPYSFANNTISDLGNTVCHGANYSNVCSPRWALMDAAFVFLGVMMAVGSLFIYQEFNYADKKDPMRRAAFAGFSLMALGGVGAIMVGLFPENTIGIVHGVGAGIAIVAGNLGILILGLALVSLPEGLRTFMRLVSVLALLAAICFASSQFFGLGKGTIERLAAYPMTVWLIVFGMYISRTHRAPAA